MSVKQENIVRTISIAAIFLAVGPAARGMHIMEGYLPPSFCIAWGLSVYPF